MMKTYLHEALNYQLMDPNKVIQPSDLQVEKEKTLNDIPLIRRLSDMPYPQLLPNTITQQPSLLNRIDLQPQRLSRKSIQPSNGTERGKSSSPRLSNSSLQNLHSISQETNLVKTPLSTNTLPLSI